MFPVVKCQFDPLPPKTLKVVAGLMASEIGPTGEAILANLDYDKDDFMLKLKENPNDLLEYELAMHCYTSFIPQVIIKRVRTFLPGFEISLIALLMIEVLSQGNVGASILLLSHLAEATVLQNEKLISCQTSAYAWDMFPNFENANQAQSKVFIELWDAQKFNGINLLDTSIFWKQLITKTKLEKYMIVKVTEGDIPHAFEEVCKVLAPYYNRAHGHLVKGKSYYCLYHDSYEKDAEKEMEAYIKKNLDSALWFEDILKLYS